jgi:hypothetical protein
MITSNPMLDDDEPKIKYHPLCAKCEKKCKQGPLVKVIICKTYKPKIATSVPSSDKKA